MRCSVLVMQWFPNWSVVTHQPENRCCFFLKNHCHFPYKQQGRRKEGSKISSCTAAGERALLKKLDVSPAGPPSLRNTKNPM